MQLKQLNDIFDQKMFKAYARKKDLKRRTCFEALGLKLWYFLILIIDVSITQAYYYDRFDIAR